MSWHRHAHSREWNRLADVPGMEVHPRTTFALSVRFETEPDLTPTGNAVAELEVVVPEFPDQENPTTFDVHLFHLTGAQAIEAGSTLVRIGEACLPGGRLEDLDLVRDDGRRTALLNEINRLLGLSGPKIQMLSSDTRRVLEWAKGRMTGEGIVASEEVETEVPEGLKIRRALGLPDDEPFEHLLDIMVGLKAGSLVTPSRHEAAREINEALYWLEDEPDELGVLPHLAAALEWLGEPLPEGEAESVRVAPPGDVAQAGQQATEDRAVRRDRKGIAEWIRATSCVWSDDIRDLLTGLAGQIERGEHEQWAQAMDCGSVVGEEVD